MEERNGRNYFNMKVRIPCKATGTIFLPDGTKEERGSGEYVFETEI